jgi:flagellar L-ring protein precursor FlgH
MKAAFGGVMISVLLAACTSVPSSIVHQPTQAYPQTAQPLVRHNGAIYQESSYRPLFEDARARHVGDVLTIAINEKTSAGKASATSNSRSANAAIAAPTLFGVPSSTTAKLGMATSSSNKLDEKGAESSSNNFSGTITVTVIEVLANGNLLVSGEKQMAFDKAAEYVRFSGIVSPQFIAPGNLVSSTQVADARFEYRSTTRVDRAEVNSVLARFFLSFVPL